MSSVEAARRAASALRLQGDSAHASSQATGSVGLDHTSRSDLFASLFASARLAQGQESHVLGTARTPQQEHEEHANGVDAENQVSQAKTKEKTKDLTARAAKRRDAAEGSARSRRTEDKQEHRVEDKTTPSETSREPLRTNREDRGHEDGSAPGEPAGESTQPSASGETSPPVPGEVALDPRIPSILVAGNVPYCPPGVADPTAAASADEGSPTAMSSRSGTLVSTQMAVSARLGLQTLPVSTSSGTESDGASSGKGELAAGIENGAAGAKPASAVGSFDHLLQAAARTKGQMLTASAVRAGGEAIRPAEPSAIDELARVIRTSGRDGQSKMILRLDPPELGQVRIDVRMQEQTLSLRMETQTQAGHDALQSRLSDLQRALEQQGIHVQKVEVELRPPPTHASPDQQAWQQHPGQDQGSRFAQSQQQQGGTSYNPSQSGGSGQSDPASTEMTEGANARSGTPWYSRQLNLVA